MSALSYPTPVSPQAVVLAQRLHDAYERRALDQFGYPPRVWDTLGGEEHRLRAEAAQELIDRGVLLPMPDCDHPQEQRTLVRREMLVCGLCGTPVRYLERVAQGAA